MTVKVTFPFPQTVWLLKPAGAVGGVQAGLSAIRIAPHFLPALNVADPVPVEPAVLCVHHPEPAPAPPHELPNNVEPATEFSVKVPAEVLSNVPTHIRTAASLVAVIIEVAVGVDEFPVEKLPIETSKTVVLSTPENAEISP